MRSIVRHAACLLTIVAAVCIGGLQAVAGQVTPRAAAAGLPYQAALVAGDGSLPVFDNATAAMLDRLLARGDVQRSGDVQRLSAASGVIGWERARTATLGHVVAAIAAMHPSPGQGCFVYATSHGAAGRGLYLAPSEGFLTPAALDRALARGCGDAPTVVIVSGCFSGSFANPAMSRANRIVLTAARQDRASFGCGAGREFTIYDACLLAALDDAPTWRRAYRSVRACVTRAERGSGFPPSGPQAYFGPDVANLSTGLSSASLRQTRRSIGERGRAR